MQSDVMYRYDDVYERGGKLTLVLRHYRVAGRTNKGAYVVGNCKKFFVTNDSLFAQSTKEAAYAAYLERKRVEIACCQRRIDRATAALRVTPDEPEINIHNKEWSHEAV